MSDSVSKYYESIEDLNCRVGRTYHNLVIVPNDIQPKTNTDDSL